MTHPANLGDLFKQTAERYPQKEAMLFKEGGRYRSILWRELLGKVSAMAAALAVKDLRRGDRIAILSENRPEWAIVDIAAQSIGAVTVPIYPTLAAGEIQYILEDSQSSIIAVSNKDLFEKICEIQKSLPSLKQVIAFDAVLAAHRDALRVPMLFLKDLERTPIEAGWFEARIGEIRAGDLASIIYTSGTTGPPKGVMLTHDNFMQNVFMTKKAMRMGPTDVHISFLPLCHVFERMAGHYLMMHIGATIGYAENMDSVPKNLLEIKPTFVLGVPRFYEKVMMRVVETVEKAPPLRKKLFFWAREIGRQKRLLLEKKETPGPMLRLQYAIANKLIYHKFRARLGGRVRFCIAGGAALPKSVAEFFCDLGVMVYEGYGLTETAPVISVNREEKFKLGTVGIPLEAVEVRISEEGEILTRSACVMKGYYNKPEETEKVLKNGYFHTGDLGSIDPEGFLSITGRKKELIVTSGGKKVSPALIEELIEKDPFVLRCVLFGEGKNFITALIVPKREKLEEYARENKIAYDGYKALLKDRKIYEHIERRIRERSADLANYEKIKYFALLEEDFTQAAGELTPTLKIRRGVVLEKYQRLLLPFYDKEKYPPR